MPWARSSLMHRVAPLSQESEQLVVLLLPGIETAATLAVLADSVAGRRNDFLELFLDLGRSQRLGIPLIALIAQFTLAVQVTDATGEVFGKMPVRFMNIPRPLDVASQRSVPRKRIRSNPRIVPAILSWYNSIHFIVASFLLSRISTGMLLYPLPANALYPVWLRPSEASPRCGLRGEPTSG